MPTYRFYNSKTKTEFEDYMTISDMEKFTKKKDVVDYDDIAKQIDEIKFSIN